MAIDAQLSQLGPLRSFAAASFSKVTPKVFIRSGRLSRRRYEELVLKRTGAVTIWVGNVGYRHAEMCAKWFPTITQFVDQ